VTGSDARLDHLVERYGGDVVPASSKLDPATSSTASKPASTRPKPQKTSSKKAPRARLVRTNDSQVIETGSPRLVGYARVSTDEQTTALQLDALRSRPGLERAIADLAPGDTLVVWKLDRLEVFGVARCWLAAVAANVAEDPLTANTVCSDPSP
jgi:hypothetical protein